jgi:hypothetical protein
MRYVVLLLALCLACSGGGGVSDEALKGFLKKGELTVDGQPAELEVMDIFLVEDEAKYPEQFHFRGKDIDLVGEFPMSLHVGYEEDIKKLENQTIWVKPKMEVYGEGEMQSRFKEKKVTTGTLKFKKYLGDPIDSGKVIEGELDLDLEGGGKAKGTFKVLAKTWG